MYLVCIQFSSQSPFHYIVLDEKIEQIKEDQF